MGPGGSQDRLLCADGAWEDLSRFSLPDASRHIALFLSRPVPPEKCRASNPHVELVKGTFDPETVYGRFPPGMPSRPESLLARAERKRGISIPSLSCRSLVVYGDSFPKERGTCMAMYYSSETLYYPGLHHWDLVVDPRVREGMAGFLRVKTAGAPS